MAATSAGAADFSGYAVFIHRLIADLFFIGFVYQISVWADDDYTFQFGGLQFAPDGGLHGKETFAVGFG